MLQQSEFFAQRIEKEAGKSSTKQIRRAFLFAFQREPDRKEMDASKKFIREEGLVLFCRALLNANEFAYIF